MFSLQSGVAMKRFLTVLAAAAALSTANAAWAQGDTSETPEKLALARMAFQLVNMPQMMDGITGMMAGLEQSTLAKSPTAEQQVAQKKAADFRKAMLEEMKENFIPKMVDQMSHVYAKTFSEGELRDILAFYQSPTGQAMIQKTPAMMREMAPAMVSDLPEFMRGTINRYCTENTCTAEDHAAFDKTLAAFPAPKR
jgi:hypothetical protein